MIGLVSTIDITAQTVGDVHGHKESLPTSVDRLAQKGG
jgi:hypothetical protein